jgi:hypothetical protein
MTTEPLFACADPLAQRTAFAATFTAGVIAALVLWFRIAEADNEHPALAAAVASTQASTAPFNPAPLNALRFNICF